MNEIIIGDNMVKKMFITDKRRILLAFLTFLILSIVVTGCSDVGLEEILENNLKTDLSQQSLQNEWALRSVYFLSKKDTVLIEACMTKKTGEEKWTYLSEVNQSQKQEMLEIVDNLSSADVDSCTDSTSVIHHMGRYLRAGRCYTGPARNSSYNVICVWMHR